VSKPDGRARVPDRTVVPPGRPATVSDKDDFRVRADDAGTPANPTPLRLGPSCRRSPR